MGQNHECQANFSGGFTVVSGGKEFLLTHNFKTMAAASDVILLFPDSVNKFLIRGRDRVLSDFGETL